VSGDQKARPDAVADIYGRTVVWHGTDELQRGTGIIFVVKRKSRIMHGQVMAIAVVSLLFLKACRIRQKYFKKVVRGSGREYRAGETELNNTGQISGVVYMCVRDDDGVECLRLERGRLPVAFTGAFNP
jgi:hypothetical protein